MGWVVGTCGDGCRVLQAVLHMELGGGVDALPKQLKHVSENRIKFIRNVYLLICVVLSNPMYVCVCVCMYVVCMSVCMCMYVCMYSPTPQENTVSALA